MPTCAIRFELPMVKQSTNMIFNHNKSCNRFQSPLLHRDCLLFGLELQNSLFFSLLLVFFFNWFKYHFGTMAWCISSFGFGYGGNRWCWNLGSGIVWRFLQVFSFCWWLAPLPPWRKKIVSFQLCILAVFYLLAQDAPSPIPGLRFPFRCGEGNLNLFGENKVDITCPLCLCQQSLLNFCNMPITQILQKVSTLYRISN